MSARQRFWLFMMLISVLAATGALATYYRNKAASVEERAAQLALEKDGLQKALALKPKEIVKLLPGEVREVIKHHMKEGNVIPVTVTKIETREVPVEVPCADGTVATPGVAARGHLFLGLTPKSVPYWDKSLFVKVGQKEVDFSDDPGIETGISDDILDAVAFKREYRRMAVLPRHPKYWRLGSGCIGGGGLDLNGGAAIGVFCGWGPQF